MKPTTQQIVAHVMSKHRPQSPSALLSRPISNLRPVHKCKLSVAAGEAIHRNWSKGILANGIKISK